MIWHVIYEDKNGQVQSIAARSRDLSIQAVCELMRDSYTIRRVIGPTGTIELAKLEEHYDEGRFPGLRS